MTAVTLESGVSSAEDAFERVRRDAPAVPERDPAPTPRARMVSAPPRASVPVASGPAHALAPTIGVRISVLRASERAAAVDPDDERPGPTPSADPTSVGRTIALAALEVLAGRRPVAQLARWLAPGVFEALQVRAALTARVLVTAVSDRPPVVRRVSAEPAGRHAQEVCVVVTDATRVRAVALRLEAHRGAWRATALEIG